MPLTKFEQAKCTSIIEKLKGWSICAPFIEPVDPERDGAPGYFDIVKNPMALNTVLLKLYSNSYNTIAEFRSDVDLIWSNAREYNGDETLITQMAEEAKIWFDKKMENFPKGPEQEWLAKLQRIVSKLKDVLNQPPSELNPRAKIASNDSAAAESEL